MIFIHIPKTAGVSISHMIMSSVLNQDTSGEIGHLSDELKFQFEIRNKQKHEFARNYVKNGHIDKKRWKEYFKFAIVRNPWDRAVSEYSWRHSLKKHHSFRDFKKFLEYCEHRLKNRPNNDIYWTHAQSQFDYISVNNNILVDKVYRFEKLDECINDISQKHDIKFELKKYNDSKHKNYRQYYNEETKKMIERLYKKDIETFEYEF